MTHGVPKPQFIRRFNEQSVLSITDCEVFEFFTLCGYISGLRETFQSVSTTVIGSNASPGFQCIARSSRVLATIGTFGNAAPSRSEDRAFRTAFNIECRGLADDESSASCSMNWVWDSRRFAVEIEVTGLTI